MVVRVLSAQLRHDCREVRRSGFWRHAVREPRDGFKTLAAPHVPAGLRPANRRPKIRLRGHRKEELGRQDAYHDVRLAAGEPRKLQRDRPPKYRRIGAETRLPGTVRKHHRGWRGRPLLVIAELPPEDRSHSERTKESAGDPQPSHALGTFGCRQVETRAYVVGRHRAKCAAPLSPIAKILVRHGSAALALHGLRTGSKNMDQP